MKNILYRMIEKFDNLKKSTDMSDYDISNMIISEVLDEFKWIEKKDVNELMINMFYLGQYVNERKKNED